MEKIVSKALLALYIMMLIWLVIFKLQFDISSILNRQQRSLNLVPFAYASKGEVILNCLFFIPFGVLLNVVFKNAGFFPKFLLIVCFSLTAELLQFIFAIGATDITDLISNSTGGLIGLTLYALCSKFIDQKRLDRIIVLLGILLLVIFFFMHASQYFRRTAFT